MSMEKYSPCYKPFIPGAPCHILRGAAQGDEWSSLEEGCLMLQEELTGEISFWTWGTPDSISKI